MAATPGLHAISAEEYHADAIADRPTLSASIATILCTSSPAHARAAHPKLNPNFERQEEQHFDIGTAAHWLLLEGDSADVVTIVDADDWRTKLAKEQRDAARAAGRLPLLAKHWNAVQAMVAATREQLDAHEARPRLFTDGKSEQTLVWEDEGGVLCRARLDWLRDDLVAVDDFKTTSRSANPEDWSRTLFGIGAEVQVAFYLRGLRTLMERGELNSGTPKPATEAGRPKPLSSSAPRSMSDPEWRFVVQETFPPYALSVVSLAPDVLALASRKVEYAIDVWARCLASGKWPAYPSRVCWAELPPWAESQWLERELREQAA